MNLADDVVGEPGQPVGRSPLAVFAAVAGGFWHGGSARRAWLLSLALGSCVLLGIGGEVAINAWHRWFFDALEQRRADTLVWAVLAFGLVVAAIAAIQVGIIVARETIQVRWREWLTGRIMDHWLERQRFYHLVTGGGISNPEYRIADDVRMAIEPLIDFAIGLLAAFVTAVAFIGILGSVGGSLTFELADQEIDIPFYMVLAAGTYGILVSLLTLRIGRLLPRRVAEKNEAEARFRFALTHFRENAESIALVRAEKDERARLGSTLRDLVACWLAVVREDGRLTWVVNGSAVLVPVVPLLLAAPKFLSGELSLGAVMQLATAFVQVQSAIAWLVGNYRAIANWRASALRVTELITAMDRLDKADRSGARILVQPSRSGGIEIEALAVESRGGSPVIGSFSLVIEHGERVLITGEARTGTSALVRAMAGLWPWGRGRIGLPAGTSLAFVPPRSYVAPGRLRDTLLYPTNGQDVADSELVAALRSCGLGHLAARLLETDRWDKVLTSGEQQRLAFARLIIQQPEIVIMDETATSLDGAAEAMLFTNLRSALPKATIVTVAFRGGLEPFHERILRLRRDPGGASVVEIGSPDHAPRVGPTVVTTH